MAAFDREAAASRLDYQLAVDGVTLYWRRGLLEEAIASLHEYGYTVLILDADGWNTDAAMHRDFATALDFPAYYGKNLDALNDSLGDALADHRDTDTGTVGIALAFSRYDTFAAASPRSARIVLDIVANHARVQALVGHRVLCLVQSDDPDLEFDPIGCFAPVWNREEWIRRRT